MNRREFCSRFPKLGVLLFVLGSMFETACSWNQSVYEQIIGYVGVGLQGFQAVVDLLVGQGVIKTGQGTAVDSVITLVNAAFAALQTAVADYQSAPAANKATMLGKISTALQVAENDIGKFWQSLSIPDANLAATIAGLLGIIVSTLAGFAVKLPAPPASMKAVIPPALAAAPKARTAKEFKKDFNNILDQNGFGQYKKF